MKRIQSWEGVVDASRDSVYSQEDEMALPQPTRLSSRVPVRKCPSVGTAKDTPPIIVHFPRPTLVSPVNSSAPIRPAPPPRPRVQIPQTPIVSQSQRARPAPVEPYTIPELPCSGTPVSPHLALPPLTPPRSPFAVGSAVTGPGARGSTSSVASESIQGYDVMKEKKALFREGQEELLSPFSPRTTRQESGLRAGPRRGTNRGVSTVDFWKRFSVSVRLDQVAQAGEKQRSVRIVVSDLDVEVLTDTSQCLAERYSKQTEEGLVARCDCPLDCESPYSQALLTRLTADCCCCGSCSDRFGPWSKKSSPSEVAGQEKVKVG